MNSVCNPLAEYDALSPYARLIVEDARRRGIQVGILDAADGFSVRLLAVGAMLRKSFGVDVGRCNVDRR